MQNGLKGQRNYQTKWFKTPLLIAALGLATTTVLSHGAHSRSVSPVRLAQNAMPTPTATPVDSPTATPAASPIATPRATPQATPKVVVKSDKSKKNGPNLNGQLVLQSMPYSPIVGRKITTWVYLPPNYDASSTRYPVVYVLHGQPGGWADCYKSGHMEEVADKMISAGEIQPLIMVAFDGDGPKGSRDMTNFCNRATDGYREEDFIVEGLVPYIDATYRTIPQASQRALMGYSGGGYGALNLGLKHPDIFNVLCSHAGFYQPAGDASVMKTILGAPGPLWDANNPLLLAQKIPADSPLHIYMDAAPGEEDYDDFTKMAKELQTRNLDRRVMVYQKSHVWRVVTEHCRDSLDFANHNFTRFRPDNATKNP